MLTSHVSMAQNVILLHISYKNIHNLIATPLVSFVCFGVGALNVQTNVGHVRRLSSLTIKFEATARLLVGDLAA